MVYVTVTQVSKDFILVEKPDAQRKSPHTLCKIFNDLEKDGYVLVGAGGSDQLVFVFHKEGLAPADEEKKEDVKETKEGKDKDKKTKGEDKDDKDKNRGSEKPTPDKKKHKDKEPK